MTKPACVAILSLIWFLSFGQSKDSLHVNFKVRFDQFPLETTKGYVTANKDSVLITAFKCYISNIEIHYADKSVFKEQNSHHLLDLENTESMQLAIHKSNDKTISKITFNVGIDSLTNASGALTGALDPVKGMYWAWQSGYINMKIEGQSPSCQTRKHQFQFHLGGYLQPFSAMRRKVIIIDKSGNINIGIDLAVLFAGINLTETHSIMTPGKAAMDLSDISTKMFYAE